MKMPCLGPTSSEDPFRMPFCWDSIRVPSMKWRKSHDCSSPFSSCFVIRDEQPETYGGCRVQENPTVWHHQCATFLLPSSSRAPLFIIFFTKTNLVTTKSAQSTSTFTDHKADSRRSHKSSTDSLASCTSIP